MGSDRAKQCQDLRFNRGFLEIISLPSNTKRLVAFSEQKLRFSDNGGKDWTTSQGSIAEAENPVFHTPVLLDDQTLFFLAKPDYYTPFDIYQSKEDIYQSESPELDYLSLLDTMRDIVLCIIY